MRVAYVLTEQAGQSGVGCAVVAIANRSLDVAMRNARKLEVWAVLIRSLIAAQGALVLQASEPAQTHDATQRTCKHSG
jgi:hypothetical protein